MAPDGSNLIVRFLSSSVGGSGRERSHHPHKHPVKPDAVLPLESFLLLGAIDVRKSVLAQREKRLAMQTLDDLNVEVESTVIPQDGYKWEIDPTKLVLKKYIAKGSYGTVHRGSYGGRDVAGNHCFSSSLSDHTQDYRETLL